MSDLSIDTTDIPGLLVLHLPLHGDNRGWFKENWQREKMTALGMPDFGPVQNNMSHNSQAGVTRGMHAEPWDKLVSVANGRILGAWVDLRDGDSFGNVVTVEMGPETAVFVPQGVANGYQALRTARRTPTSSTTTGRPRPRSPTPSSTLRTRHWASSGRYPWTRPNCRRLTVITHR